MCLKMVNTETIHQSEKPATIWTIAAMSMCTDLSSVSNCVCVSIMDLVLNL